MIPDEPYDGPEIIDPRALADAVARVPTEGLPLTHDGRVIGRAYVVGSIANVSAPTAAEIAAGAEITAAIEWLPPGLDVDDAEAR